MNTPILPNRRNLPCEVNQEHKAPHAGRAVWLLMAVLALVLLLQDAVAGTRLPSVRDHAVSQLIPWSELGAKATAQYSGDGLEVTTTEGGALLRCAFQKLEGEATHQGLWLTSTSPESRGERFRVVAQAVGRTTGMKTLPPKGVVEVHAQVARFLRPGLVEEYSVSVDGVRQDFVIAQQPAGEGDLHVELELSGAKAETVVQEGARLVLAGSGRQINYHRLQVTDTNGKVLPARIEMVSASELTLVVEDTGAMYPVRIDPTFSDENWFSMGGFSGADYHVNAAVVDEEGNVYIGGGFTVVGDVAASRIAKWDGNHWSALGSGLNGSVNALALLGTTLIAGGSFSGADGAPANGIAMWNGTTWAAIGSGVNGPIHALAASDNVLYVGGEFTIAGGVDANSIAKWDGHNWSALGAGMNSNVLALALFGDDLFAAGEFTNAGGKSANYVARWDGSAWHALGSGMDASVYALAASGNYLYAGGEFTTAGGMEANYIAKWDGLSWSTLGSGMGSGSYGVYSLAALGETLYAGGWFGTAGGVWANHIAKWDGNAWSAVGQGLANRANALVVSGADLYAGGYFTAWNEYPGNYIARWDGANWSVPGSAHPGLSGSVSALAVSGDDLYAGGSFSSAGGINANDIAKWNGSGWSALGSGLDWVRALAVSGSDLYAGGYFQTAGGVSARRIAKWDGFGWTPLGSGVDHGDSSYSSTAVFALAVSGSDLYAAGNFTTAGTIDANYIAKWNGSEWASLGSGMNGQVMALVVSGDELYAGGRFTTAGGIVANGIAKWNGSSWSPLGTGMGGFGSDTRVSALLALDGILYAGGYFQTAGGVSAKYIAKWDGTAWSALGSGMNGSVSALSASEGNLYVGGSFTTAGGLSAKRIAKWDGATWSGLGSGIGGVFSPGVAALAISGTSLYAGGEFSTAGGKVSANLARAIIPAHQGPPVILDQPQAQMTQAGTSISFAVKAIGEPPLFFQWSKDNTPLLDGGNTTGAKTAMIVLSSVQTSNAGVYSVAVSNARGTAISSNAVLTVTPALTLNEALDTSEWNWTSGGDLPWIGQTDVAHDGVDATQSGAVTHGRQSWMETTLTGPGILSFWWKVSSEANYDFLELYVNSQLQNGRISGEVNWQQRTLILPSEQQIVRWRYIKDGTENSGRDCGWVDMVAFAPVAPPEIVNQPSDQRAVLGSDVAFSVTAFGTPPLSFQWRKDSVALSDGVNISGVNTPGLALTKIGTGDSGGYSVVVSNSFGSITSTVAMLTVTVPQPPPVGISPCYSVADTAQTEFALSSAFDGVNFLIGICGNATNPNNVGAQLLSPSGTKIGGFTNTGRLMDGFLDGPRVAFGGPNYLMVWTDAYSQHTSSGNDIYAQFISPSGNLVGSAFPVSTAAEDQYARGVAFDGTNFLVIWADQNGLHARPISSAGQLLGEELLLTTEEVEEAAAVAYGGGQYLVAWVEGWDGAHVAKGRLVSPAGVPGKVLPLSQNNSHRYNPISVAYGEDRFMVVWHHNADENADWNLRGRMVLPDGTLAGIELFLVSGDDDDFAWANNVVFDGENFLLSWTQANGNPTVTDSVVWGQYWKPSGLAHGSPFIVDNTVRSKLGVGLCGANGKVLTVINTGIMASTANVCARIITRPMVALAVAGPNSVQITYSGVLQCSTNLTHWTDCSPQPTSPWITPATGGTMFFRAR